MTDDPAKTELAEPVTKIAIKNFEYKLPAIKARAVARTIIKYVATKGAQAAAKKAGGGALGATDGRGDAQFGVALEVGFHARGLGGGAGEGVVGGAAGAPRA